MKIVKFRIILLLIGCFVFIPNSAISGSKDNASNSKACFHTRGVLAVYANMNPYLQPSHERRKYAIASAGENTELHYQWPKQIQDQLTLDNQMSGDFLVCPTRPYKKGVMQFVKIKSVKNMRIQDR